MIQWHSNGPYLSTSAVMRHVAQGPFDLVGELWMPVHSGGTNIPLEFPALELLVLGRERSFALGFSGMLAPQDGKVPSPRIETIEIRGRVDLVIVAEFATVLHDSAKAGCWLLSELSGGMELPEICDADLGERRLLWRKDPSEHLGWSWPSILPVE